MPQQDGGGPLDKENQRSMPGKPAGIGEPPAAGDRRHQDNLDPRVRSEIGRKGGAAVSQNRSHMSQIGHKGGEAVSQDRAHMSEIGKKGGEAVAHERGPGFYSEIGRKGGEAVSQDRAHMSEIGRKGGEARSGHRR